MVGEQWVVHCTGNWRIQHIVQHDTPSIGRWYRHRAQVEDPMSVYMVTGLDLDGGVDGFDKEQGMSVGDTQRVRMSVLAWISEESNAEGVMQGNSSRAPNRQI